MIPQVELGQTGLVVSRFCFGTGTNGWGGRSNQTDLGHDKLVRLLRLAYDLGITFWDTADQYGSHPHVRDALRGLDRASVTVMTKTTASDYPTAAEAIPRFLRELGTDYVDIVLLHCLSAADWPTRYAGAMDALGEAKEKGLVRAVGISSHGLGALRAAAEQPWCGVIVERLNYAGQMMDGSTEEVIAALEQAHTAGKGICAMKVLARGQLRAQRRRALQYVLDLPCVDAILVGLEGELELRQDADTFAEQERALAA